MPPECVTKKTGASVCLWGMCFVSPSGGISGPPNFPMTILSSYTWCKSNCTPTRICATLALKGIIFQGGLRGLNCLVKLKGSSDICGGDGRNIFWFLHALPQHRLTPSVWLLFNGVVWRNQWSPAFCLYNMQTSKISVSRSDLYL